MSSRDLAHALLALDEALAAAGFSSADLRIIVPREQGARLEVALTIGAGLAKKSRLTGSSTRLAGGTIRQFESCGFTFQYRTVFK